MTNTLCAFCQKELPQGAKFCAFCGKRQNKTTKSGKHRLHFRYKDPQTGLSKDKYVYGKTRVEAERLKRFFLNQVDQGLRVSELGYTLAQWAEEWLTTYKLNTVKPSTYAAYAADVKRLKEQLGHKPLSNILPIDVVRLMDTRRGCSTSAIRKTYITINAIMTAAVDNRLIPFNPCRSVTVPSGTAGSHRALSQSEIATILAVARAGHRFSLPVLLMLFAGLRRGEVAALHSKDVDKEGIHVRRSVFWNPNQAVFTTPKTKAGLRTIPILPPLEPFMDFSGYAAKPYFGTGDTPISLQSFERGFESFIKACEERINGCKQTDLAKDQAWKSFPVRTHDLRHTYATLLYNAGVDLKTAQHWLGHADPAVTLKIYTHLTDSKRTEASKTVAEYVSITDMLWW